jgi:hypothetical protein
VLLMALDDYYNDPSQDCLARLFDAVNSMDISAAPTLTRNEKIVMRCSERKDIFAEKFSHPRPSGDAHLSVPASGKHSKQMHRTTNSGGSSSSFEEGILIKKRGSEANRDTREWERPRERKASGPQSTSPPRYGSPSESSFSLGGNPVWVGNESGLDDAALSIGDGSGSSAASVGGSTVVTSRGRKSTDASSTTSSQQGQGYGQAILSATTPSYHNSLGVKDTHFYHTTLAYKGHQLPIKLPLYTFPEEVGDVSF